MRSWKRLIGYLKKDFALTKRDLITFSIGYTVLTIMYYLITEIFNTQMSSQPFLVIPFLFIMILYSIGMVINQYFFQKRYTDKLSVPANINKVGSVIISLIKVYFLQFLIFLGIVVGIVITLIFMSAVLKSYNEFFHLLILIVSFCITIFGFFWFYRLAFISYILVYSRINMQLRTIILESKYLIKENIGLIIIQLVIGFIPVFILVAHALVTHSQMKIGFLFSVFFTLIGLLTSYIFIVITENTIIDHKYYFLLEPKKENS